MPKSLPHTALIYIDQQDRNRLINSCLHQAEEGWDSVTVLSAQPNADAKSFGRLIQKKRSQRDRVLSVVDFTDPLRGKGTAKEITSVVIRKHTELGKKPLIIADWLHQVYGKFEVGLAVEEALAEANVDNLICCYRGEGFCSLHIRQIAHIFELHSLALLGSSVFDDEVRSSLKLS